MTAKEIRELSPEEIDTKLRETRDQNLKLHLHQQTGQVEKTHEMRSLRKDVARLETIRRQKQSAAGKPAVVRA